MENLHALLKPLAVKGEEYCLRQDTQQVKSLPSLNTIIMTCFNNVPRGLGPWSMPHGFSFHWSQLGVQVSHLPLLYLHPSIVLLFTYLGLYNAAAASLRLCVCRGTKRICAWNEFAHVVQGYLLGTSTGMSHFAHPQAARKTELQKMRNWVFLKHCGSLKCWCLEVVGIFEVVRGDSWKLACCLRITLTCS